MTGDLRKADEKNPISVVTYLTQAAEPQVTDCDLDQIEALGSLDSGNRIRAISVLAEALRPRFTNNMRERLVRLMRAMRSKGQLKGAGFLVALFQKIDGESLALARERANQATAEDDVLSALELWSSAFVVYFDTLALTSIARLIHEASKSETPELKDRITRMIVSLEKAAESITIDKSADEYLIPRLERLGAVLTANNHLMAGQAIGKLLIDIRLRQAFSI